MMNMNKIQLGMIVGLVSMLGLTGCAPVTVSSTPSGAGVYTKNKDKLIGTTPLSVNLIANDKELVLRKEGYFSKTIMLSPTDPEDAMIELRRRDRVLLLSEPNGAELFVKGLGRVGHTPYRVDYSKPYRTFEVRALGYAPVTFTVPEDPEDHVLIKLDRADTVMVVSKPKNAEIFDMKEHNLGSTPIAVPATEERTYEIRKDGYYSQQFMVDDKTVSPKVIELEREPIVLVHTEPSGAYILHQGVTLGRTPFRHLVKKAMDVEIRADRYYTREVTLTPDSPRMVEIDLEAMPYVTIQSEPSGAKLYLSGGVELVGTTPLEVLIEKDTAYEIHKPGYDIKAFMLSPESSPAVTVSLVESLSAQEKTIKIDSNPTGAEVYRPGGAELIGTTPFTQRVRGERTFELHKSGYETKIVTVATDSADNVVFALAKDESARNVTVSDPLLNTPSSF